MKRLVSLATVGMLIAAMGHGCGFRALSPSREASDHSTTEGPVLHTEATTLINPELRALAEEVKGDLRNSVTNSSATIQNDIKPMLWFMLGVQALQLVRDYVPRRRTK